MAVNAVFWDVTPCGSLGYTPIPKISDWTLISSWHSTKHSLGLQWICLSHLRIWGRNPRTEIAASAKQGLSHHWKFFKDTSVCDLHVAFQIPYMYDYITKLCRQQAEVIQIKIMKMLATLAKAKTINECVRGLILAAVTCTTVQVSRLSRMPDSNR
jgi:hypothetical protein